MSNKPVDSSCAAKFLIDIANERKYSGITPLKLIKMVYIAHGWMLALYDEPLIADDIEAWKYGPVVHPLYQKIKKFKDRQITELPDDDNAELSEAQKSILAQTYEKYHHLPATQLIALTHNDGTPWAQIYSGKLYQVIPNNVIKEYYKNLL